MIPNTFLTHPLSRLDGALRLARVRRDPERTFRVPRRVAGRTVHVRVVVVAKITKVLSRPFSHFQIYATAKIDSETRFARPQILIFSGHPVSGTSTTSPRFVLTTFPAIFCPALNDGLW